VEFEEKEEEERKKEPTERNKCLVPKRSMTMIRRKSLG